MGGIRLKKNHHKIKNNNKEKPNEQLAHKQLLHSDSDQFLSCYTENLTESYLS